MEHVIKAESRDLFKKKVKQLRKDGSLPAAVFGFKGNQNVQLNTFDFTRLYDEVGHSTVIEIDLSGTKHNVLIDEVQMNPVTRVYSHVSLREVNMNVELSAVVPFELTGEEESPAVKDENSLVILSLPEIEVKGLPKDLPSEIKLDVSAFHAGDTIKLKDIKLPQGIELVHTEEDDLEEVVVTTTSAIQEEVEHVDYASGTTEGEEAAATTDAEATPEATEEKA